MQNKITPRLIKLARLLVDMTMDEVVLKYGVSYYLLKKIERNFDLDLYADSRISTKVISSLERFMTDSGIQFINDGVFTGVYFANDGTDRQFEGNETNDNLLKLNKKLERLEQDKISLITEAKAELEQLQLQVKDMRNKCDNMSEDINFNSSNLSKKINS
ncbi:MAG: hypothetical protein HOM96_02340 [Rickettsiales bacterium]|jgi:hypothetical protein|nr:hypothetical protein [Rickettsiales bacterium]